jgi:uncharacterized protein (UPF0335 family)
MSDAETKTVSARLRQAIEQFRDTVTKDGGSCVITAGGKSVTVGPAPAVPTSSGTVTPAHNELPLDVPKDFDPKRANVGRLKGFIERIEKVEEERKAVGTDISDIYSEAKGGGYDVGTIRALIKLRKMDPGDRDERDELLDVYKHALGMV